MIPWLDDMQPVFPPVDKALKEPNGLLCAGGNLEVETLRLAYCQGLFPWFNESDPVLWWSPDPRMVLTPDSFHLSRRFKRFLRRCGWRVTSNNSFEAVIRACSTVPREGQNGTWITETMIQAYLRFHRAGYASSIEVWDAQSRLCGGLYGVAMGRMFFGESMFSLVANASKVALTALITSGSFDLVDCQMQTAHLTSLGGVLLRRGQFLPEVSRLTALAAIGFPDTLDPAILRAADV